MFKKNNCVIDYTNSVIDYQRGFSRNIANSHILSFEFWLAINGSYLGNCPDLHLSRFLLLLCQKVGLVSNIVFFFLSHVIHFTVWRVSQDLSSMTLVQLSSWYLFLFNCSVFGGQLVLRLPSGVVWLKICFGVYCHIWF